MPLPEWLSIRELARDLGIEFYADISGPSSADLGGELSLDGRIRSINGVLSAALLARSKGLRGVLVPKENAREAAVVDGITVLAGDCGPF